MEGKLATMTGHHVVHDGEPFEHFAARHLQSLVQGHVPGLVSFWDVVAAHTVAKRDLTPGDVLDGVGGFMAYGEIDNTATIADEGLLLMGLAAGSRVVRPVLQDRPITLEDVELDEDRLTVQLRQEQDKLFG